MARQRRADPRLSLEVGFEPRRGGQDTLTNAYQRLLPLPLRSVRPAPRTGTREKVGDAGSSDDLDADTARGPDPGGDLRQGVFRPAG